MLRLREFTPRDEAAVLTLFDSNVPTFFRPHEREEFTSFLEDPRCDYLVLEDDDAIVGAGGSFVRAHVGHGVLCWGMIRRDAHRRGYGRRLLLARLASLARVPDIDRIMLDTSQHSRGFFERMGFRVLRVTTDAYGAGLHRHDMALDLTPARRQALSRLWNGAVVRFDQEPLGTLPPVHELTVPA